MCIPTLPLWAACAGQSGLRTSPFVSIDTATGAASPLHADARLPGLPSDNSLTIDNKAGVVYGLFLNMSKVFLAGVDLTTGRSVAPVQVAHTVRFPFVMY